MCVLLIQIEELESELDEQSILQASVSQPLCLDTHFIVLLRLYAIDRVLFSCLDCLLPVISSSAGPQAASELHSLFPPARNRRESSGHLAQFAQSVCILAQSCRSLKAKLLASRNTLLKMVDSFRGKMSEVCVV